jgi:hypothetical protein
MSGAGRFTGARSRSAGSWIAATGLLINGALWAQRFDRKSQVIAA